jgi:hypothetical protein
MIFGQPVLKRWRQSIERGLIVVDKFYAHSVVPSRLRVEKLIDDITFFGKSPTDPWAASAAQTLLKLEIAIS